MNLISNEDSVMSAMIKLSKGNPGAATVLGELYEKYKEKCVFILIKLDDLNIFGQRFG